MEQKSPNLFELHIDPQSQSYLSETAKWAKFLAILGFIMITLIAVFMLIGGATAFSTLQGFGGGYDAVGIGATGMVIMLIFLALAVIPYVYLYRFAVKMQVALRNNDQGNLTASFGSLKSCYKYVGIFTIIILSLYLIIFIYGILRMGMAGF